MEGEGRDRQWNVAVRRHKTFVRSVADPGSVSSISRSAGILRSSSGGSPSGSCRGPRSVEAPDSSLVVLTAWRTASMDDERWRRLVVAHETEALLLRRRIEAVAG